MRKVSFSRKCFIVFNTVLMLLAIVVAVFPYLNILAKALNDSTDTMRGGILFWPRVFTWKNFETVLVSKGVARAFVISVLRVVACVIWGVTVRFLTAYVFTEKRLPGRSAILIFFMIPMYVSGGLIASYILYSKLGLLNNYMLYVLPAAFTIYDMVIIRTYINGLPDGLKEAARIDGASEVGILARIVFPLSMPIVATISLWIAVGTWNDWTTSMYFFTKKDMHTLQYLLVKILKETETLAAMLDEAMKHGVMEGMGETRITPEAVRCAQIIITTIPIIVTYPFLQKYFIKGALVGAIKD